MLADHLPSESGTATVFFDAQEGCIVTFLPESVQPQTAAWVFCWKTILSLKKEGSVTFALASMHAAANSTARRMEMRRIFFIPKYNNHYRISHHFE